MKNRGMLPERQLDTAVVLNCSTLLEKFGVPAGLLVDEVSYLYRVRDSVAWQVLNG